MGKIPLLKRKIIHIVYTLMYRYEMLWESGVSIVISIRKCLGTGNLSVLQVCVCCGFFVFSSLQSHSFPSPSIRPISFKQSMRVLEKSSCFYRKPGKQEQGVSDHPRRSRVLKFGAFGQRSATLVKIVCSLKLQFIISIKMWNIILCLFIKTGIYYELKTLTVEQKQRTFITDGHLNAILRIST